jgi:hypothetical protein
MAYDLVSENKSSMDCVFETLDGVQIWIGNREAALDSELLKSKGIDGVLSMTDPDKIIAP